MNFFISFSICLDLICQSDLCVGLFGGLQPLWVPPTDVGAGFVLVALPPCLGCVCGTRRVQLLCFSKMEVSRKCVACHSQLPGASLAPRGCL